MAMGIMHSKYCIYKAGWGEGVFEWTPPDRYSQLMSGVPGFHVAASLAARWGGGKGLGEGQVWREGAGGLCWTTCCSLYRVLH